MEKKAPSLIEMFNLIPKFNLGLIILVTLMTTSTYPRWAECLRSSGSSSSSISIQSTSSNPPLAESFSEGACVIPQTSRKLDTKWLIRQSTFYIPIASQFTFRLYAETFLSRAGVTEQDVKSMCLTMDFFPDGPGVNLTNTGYDLRDFRQTCPVIWRGQFTCLPVGGSPGTNPARARSTDNYVVSVDNQSYMLVVRCIDGFFKDYILLTTRPVVSPELYHTVRSTIKELGFDERKLQMLKYDSCLRTDRFVTAVNVHHHHHHNNHHRQDEGDNDLGNQHSITITKSGGGTGSVRGQVISGQLRPSFGGPQIGSSGPRRRIEVEGEIDGAVDGIITSFAGAGGGRGGSNRIHNIEIQGIGNLISGGSSAGGGRKVEEVEAYYAIIP